MAIVVNESEVSKPEPEKVVRTEADRPQRAKRVPVGLARTKLGVDMAVPGHHLHWFNDEGSRLFDAQQGGYTFVDPQEVGLTHIKETQVKRLVGRNEGGSPQYAYLMKIPMEYFLEDREAGLAQPRAFEEAIKRGKLDEKPGENRYNAGIKIFR